MPFRYLGLVAALTVIPFGLVQARARRKKHKPEPDLHAIDLILDRIRRGPVTLTPEEEIAIREVLAFVAERDELPDHVQWAVRRLRDVEARCAV